MPRGDLFPDIGPNETGYLPLSGGHVMYWEQVGNPYGVPVLFLHGGPGAGAGTVHRRFFDPVYWRAVIFDQRGAGRSRPLGSLARNTTQDLIQDIELLRVHLGVERWLLFGGSWGSTLALAYAQAHPDRVLGCVLRGIFLGREQEVAWFLYGLRQIFPEAHAAFANFLPPEERHDLLAGYISRLNDTDPAVHMPAAQAWSLYEGSCSTLLPNPDTVGLFARDRGALGLARIEAHYFANRLFLPPEGLLGHMDRIATLPAEIVQGRYDMICPAYSAFDLAACWPAAKLTVIPDAGHSALEPGIRRALVAAVERFRRQIG
ncbi:prolyl aminopeptidase [Granulibacter bethesdensis]|uniref:prolyl aminopeptidase n=1 Tax=Granulibacter bethesdensis TaxID=364410 RepID=UPI0003F1CADC|nr:prolyl aminopeptidase [Granulibacter bethesdensis]AHJ67155.1 Proline iminopeptidase [Granulibacter bethesdensis]